MTALMEVLVPDLGDIKDVPVIEVLARVGANVQKDETLVVLETEKATMDVPSTAAGKVREVRVKVGDRVNLGSVLVLVEDSVAEEAAPAAPSSNSPASTAVVQVPSAVSPAESLPPPAASPALFPAKPPVSVSFSTDVPHASPSIRRVARELGVNLVQVHGSGPKGRIVPSDLQQFVKSALSSQAAAMPALANATPGLDLLPWPQIDFARFGPVERTPRSKISRISGANLLRNSILIPHVTNFDEADITELESFRVGVNAGTRTKRSKLTMLAFLIKASAAALKAHPTFNASLDGDELVLKRYFHIGFAADTPNGLIVPVIRDADTKGLAAIAAEAGELAALAREGKLKPTDMQGGSFTVSSLGGIGGTGFTPIINAPEVAILGAARGKMTPVWNGESFAPRLILPLSLSWDHRVIDGAAAARFLVTLVSLLGDFRRVSL